MDLSGWPPQSGGSYKSGEVFPVSSEEVTIEQFLLAKEGHIAFTCRFNEKSVPYDFFIADENIAAKFIKLLGENRGMRLFDMGFIEVPPDES
jgi:hypothetical protein